MSKVNSLLLNDGDVYFISAQRLLTVSTNTLTPVNFSGSGNFTCIPRQRARGDQLVVNNNATGNF